MEIPRAGTSPTGRSRARVSAAAPPERTVPPGRHEMGRFETLLGRHLGQQPLALVALNRDRAEALAAGQLQQTPRTESLQNPQSSS